MKKTALFLALILLISTVALASCDLLPFGDKTCTDHADENHDFLCDKCGAELEKQDTPTCQHKDEDKDHNCDLCAEQISKHRDTEDHICDICGAQFTECQDVTRDHLCELCEKVLSPCVDENNNHKCDLCGEWISDHTDSDDHYCDICGAILTECADEDGNYACDICGGDLLPSNMERVEYSLNISDLATGTYAEDAINGKFTVIAGSTVRDRTKTFEGVEYTKSVKIGDKATKIKIDVPGAGKLSFLIQNGSSSATTQFVTVTAPDGKVYDIEFTGTDGGSPVVKIEIDVTAGEWIISRGKNGGTQDVFALALSCVVEKSDENGFELVSPGTVDYLCGQELDLSGVRLNTTFANGKTEPLAIEDVTVDISAVDMLTSGSYPVTISYKDYAPITLNINVYLPTEIILGIDAIEKLAQNSSAGNGVYYNHSLRELYFAGEELDLTGLTVIVVGGIVEGDGVALKEFNVGKQYAVVYSEFAEGENLITIKYIFGENEIEKGFYVNVCFEVITPDEFGVIQALVDPNYLGPKGCLSGPYHCFSTIQQALDFLNKVDPATPKVLSIAPGYYSEKLEITVPNLTILGVTENPADVVIEWDSIYGQPDASGFVHTTDSTATVAVRESATNVVIKNLTISNYWNSQERMDEAGLAIERGLALLVQADRFTMTNSVLLGIQDTLELFTGRQYFENVFISGYTDFIFGTNNTTYFKNCVIHVIDTEKDDKGTAGYVTAFKGSNKGAQDAIVYGAIFDGCKFTADEGVTAGKTAIGRTWGAYAAVAVINSEIGGHISVDGYDSANNKNKRYISMNGIHPTDSTVQFVEFNNTGAGAITEAVPGMRFLTADEAKLYADFATIFGTVNGKVSYLDLWDPTSTEVVVDDRDYYYFNGSSSASGTSHTFDTATKIENGSTCQFDGLLISAENGKVAWNQNANSLNMKAGAFISFTVPAGTSVTVETYPNYNYFTLNGVGTVSANMLTQYYAEETEVILLSTGDLYLYSIIINPGEEAPASPEIVELKASGMKTNYTAGEELSYDGLVIKAIYSDNSVRFITDYQIDTSAVKIDEAGAYSVIFIYGEYSAAVEVKYEAPNADPAITEDIVLDFTTVEGLEAVQNNPKVVIDGSVRHNGGEIQIKGTISFPIKAGTTVRVIPYANTSYASYTMGDGEFTSEVYNAESFFLTGGDCTFTYTGLDNNYLCKIIIECPVNDGKYVFGGSSEEGDVTGILSSVNGIHVSGTIKTHSGGAQLAQDSEITMNVPAFTNVTIKGYDASYGQLNVYVGGEFSSYIEMTSDGYYVFTTGASYVPVTITAKNVGTEEEPAYNKSYITFIDIQAIPAISEDITVSFGSEGNYKESGIDFSGASVRDNGGNNSQISSGSFSFLVNEGALVKIHGYSGYTSYSFTDGNQVFEEITDENFAFLTRNTAMITISAVNGNNYLYSISIEYPVAIDETTSISFGSAGNYKESGIDFSGITIGDNGGNNSQIKNGSFSFAVKKGAKVTVHGYSGYTSYNFGDGDIVYENITDEYFTYEAFNDCVITISHTSGNNYFYSFSIQYPVEVVKESFTVSFGSEGNYKEAPEVVDLSNVQIGDNGGDNSQVKNGYITIQLLAGAKVTINGYPGYTSYTLATEEGNSAEITDQTYLFNTDFDCTLTITPVSGNNYFYSIVVEY